MPSKKGAAATAASAKAKKKKHQKDLKPKNANPPSLESYEVCPALFFLLAEVFLLLLRRRAVTRDHSMDARSLH